MEPALYIQMGSVSFPAVCGAKKVYCICSLDLFICDKKLIHSFFIGLPNFSLSLNILKVFGFEPYILFIVYF